MTSFMALDGVAKNWHEFFSAMAESRKKLKTSNVFTYLLCVRIEIDQLQCVNC